MVIKTVKGHIGKGLDASTRQTQKDIWPQQEKRMSRITMTRKGKNNNGQFVHA